MRLKLSCITSLTLGGLVKMAALLILFVAVFVTISSSGTVILCF